MTKTELPRQASQLHAEAASATTCTATVVEALRSLLLPDSVTAPSDAKTDNKTPRANARSSQRSNIRARATKQAAIVICEDVRQDEDDELTIEQRQTLATKVVNDTLKSLTEAAKQPSTHASASEKSGGLPQCPNDSSSPTTSRSGAPLKSTNANQRIKSAKLGVKRRSSNDSKNTSSLKNQARCCQIAFGALRFLQAKDKREKTSPSLQLDQGASALIHKLIALGFNDLAVKELRTLIRRLISLIRDSQPLIQSRTKAGRPAVDKSDQDSTKKSLIELLSLGRIPQRGPLLSLVISTQLQILRVSAATHAGDLSVLFQVLNIDREDSPNNVIRAQIDHNQPATVEKAAADLEVLAQLVLRICDQSYLSLGRAQSPLQCDSAETILKLQTRACTIRAHSWALTRRVVDVTHDIVLPFTQFFEDFRKYSQHSKEGQYDSASQSFDVLASILPASGPFQEQALIPVYRILAVFAGDALRDLDVSHWTTKAMRAALEEGVSPLQKCIGVCQTLTLEIRTTPSQGPTTPSSSLLEAAVDCLSSNLQGDSTDLDELLITVASLRKSLCSVLMRNKSEEKAPKTPSDLDLERKSLQLIAFGVRFFVRYLGDDSGLTSSERTISRYYNRAKLVTPIVVPTTEAIANLACVFARSTVEDWNLISSALEDCLTLNKALVDHLTPRGKSTPETARKGPNVSLAHSHWCRYLSLKRLGASTRDQRQSLRKSVDILRHGSREDRLSGSLLLKLDHFGHHHEEVRDYAGALEIYEEAWQLHLRLEVVARIAESISSRPADTLFDLDEDSKLLAKALDARLRLTAKLHRTGVPKHICYDCSELPRDQRIVLLDHQFGFAVKQVQMAGSHEISRRFVYDVSSALLRLCSFEDYPLRYLRHIIRLLFLRIVQPAAVAQIDLEPILESFESPSKAPIQDANLQSYMAHLTDSLHLLVLLRSGSPDAAAIEKILVGWADMLLECPDLTALHHRVYDLQMWRLHLDLIVDYLDFQGFRFLKALALHVSSLSNGIWRNEDTSAQLSHLLQLASQRSQLGYTALGHLALQKARICLKESGSPLEAQVRWYLGSIETALMSQDLEKCTEQLGTARSALKQLNEARSCQRVSIDRSDFLRIIAEMALLQSRIAVASHQPYEALLFARFGVKIYEQIWSILERRSSQAEENRCSPADEAAGDSVTGSLSTLTLSEQSSTLSSCTRSEHLYSASFWPVTPRLLDGLLLLSSRFCHASLGQQASYYLDKARKIAEATRSNYWRGLVNAAQCQFHFRSGNLQQATALIDAARATPAVLDLASLTMQTQVAAVNLRLGNCQAASETFLALNNSLKSLRTRKQVDRLIRQSVAANDQLDALVASVGKMNLGRGTKTTDLKAQTSAISSRSRLNVAKPTMSVQQSSETSETLPDNDVLPLLLAERCSCHEEAMASVAFDHIDRATSLLEESETLPLDDQSTILQALVRADIDMRRGLQHLVTHPVLSVVTESTIAYPSVIRPDRSPETSIAKDNVPRTGRQTQTRKPAVRSKHTAHLIEEKYGQLLQAAQKHIVNILKLAQKASSIALVHHMLELLSRTIITLSALPASSHPSSVSSLFLVFVSELGRMAAMLQGILSSLVERQMSDLASAGEFATVEVPASVKATITSMERLDLQSFQSDFIETIPRTWDVVSMSLSESGSSILVSRLRHEETPFVLNIPLQRQSGLVCDDESFSFLDAKKELESIIEMANTSSQDAQNQVGKTAKSEWWSARKRLDSRLSDLLKNIENIWFGGFRGIFSQQSSFPHVLARFQESLNHILDRHLPSRRGSGKGKRAGTITLDPHILGLFVNLGCPDIGNDIDDQILDLLYFVVDIYQFNGERNAYDEIDLDHMAIETLEALRSYYQAVEWNGNVHEKRHTILILDKKLHGFPWESLPTLRGKSISRLPSLSCLRDRVLGQRSHERRRSDMSYQWNTFSIPRDNGAFILNPAGDLKSTQEKFEDSLGELPHWQGISQREPLESEFREFLESRELFLYFGHGSGSQYIRPGTIKRLERCAVALLMGCSSGSLTQMGDFEPYGTPINYIQAGCPALLANLWDVTDKDIDRFAQTTLEGWGLFERRQQVHNDGSPVKRSAKQKGKGRAVKEIPTMLEEHELQARMSLDQAVAAARDSCILKYLNGAAPVIYGIPVFLD